jgi:hypothetical protein
MRLLDRISGSGREEGAQVGTTDRLGSELAENPVQLGHGNKFRSSDLDSDRAACSTEVDHQARFDPASPIALLAATTREVVVRSDRAAPTECDFEIRLAHVCVYPTG